MSIFSVKLSFKFFFSPRKAKATVHQQAQLLLHDNSQDLIRTVLYTWKHNNFFCELLKVVRIGDFSSHAIKQLYVYIESIPIAAGMLPVR